MRDIEMQKARRVARRNVRNAKHAKGWISGEQAAKIQKAIKNSK